jgi:hypothetical protein
MKQHTAQMSGRTVVTILGLLLLASAPVVAAQPTVSFSITGVGSGGSLDGVYTSPYAGTVNGIATPVICDDFANTSYVPEDWTAYQTSLSSVNAGTDTPADLKWNNANSNGAVDGYAGWDLNQKTAYDVAAYLAIELDSSPAASTASEDLSYAMWELFDATGASSTNLNSDGDTVVSWLSGDPTTLKNATVDVENAISEICATGGGCTTTAGVKSVNGTPTVLNGWSINIYTIPSGDSPTCPDNTGGVCGSAPPQEFITVPESSSVPGFALYLLFGGASLLFFGRRRVFKG